MGRKIAKNLTDQDMVANWHEKVTFENSCQDQKAAKPVKKTGSDFSTDFFTSELQEKVGKALLAQKVDLYKQGIVDYRIKVIYENNEIILKPEAVKKPAHKE